ncbi:MAG: hypothetical protein EOP88_19970, partial [Verrucomicrobiaceae bacterium]
MNTTAPKQRPVVAGFLPVLAGSSLFLAYQFVISIWNLVASTSGGETKFKAVATEVYMGFILLQNLQVLVAYIVLGVIAALILQPFVNFWTARSRYRSRRSIILRSLGLTAVMHGFFTLRLVETRPYFLDAAEFGHWYYRILDVIPAVIKPASLVLLFTVLPVVVLVIALFWQIRRRGRKGWVAASAVSATVLLTAGYQHFSKSTPARPVVDGKQPMNVLIIGSDSLRGDRLGIAGYRPARTDGPAAQGVSPAIDALARDSSGLGLYDLDQIGINLSATHLDAPTQPWEEWSGPALAVLAELGMVTRKISRAEARWSAATSRPFHRDQPSTPGGSTS